MKGRRSSKKGFLDSESSGFSPSASFERQDGNFQPVDILTKSSNRRIDTWNTDIKTTGKLTGASEMNGTFIVGMLERCEECGKKFINAFYLEKHKLRRHGKLSSASSCKGSTSMHISPIVSNIFPVNEGNFQGIHEIDAKRDEKRDLLKLIQTSNMELHRAVNNLHSCVKGEMKELQAQIFALDERTSSNQAKDDIYKIEQVPKYDKQQKDPFISQKNEEKVQKISSQTDKSKKTEINSTSIQDKKHSSTPKPTLNLKIEEDHEVDAESEKDYLDSRGTQEKKCNQKVTPDVSSWLENSKALRQAIHTLLTFSHKEFLVRSQLVGILRHNEKPSPEEIERQLGLPSKMISSQLATQFLDPAYYHYQRAGVSTNNAPMNFEAPTCYLNTNIHSLSGCCCPMHKETRLSKKIPLSRLFFRRQKPHWNSIYPSSFSSDQAMLPLLSPMAVPQPHTAIQETGEAPFAFKPPHNISSSIRNTPSQHRMQEILVSPKSLSIYDGSPNLSPKNLPVHSSDGRDGLQQYGLQQNHALLRPIPELHNYSPDGPGAGAYSSQTNEESHVNEINHSKSISEANNDIVLPNLLRADTDLLAPSIHDLPKCIGGSKIGTLRERSDYCDNPYTPSFREYSSKDHPASMHFPPPSSWDSGALGWMDEDCSRFPLPDTNFIEKKKSFTSAYVIRIDFKQHGIVVRSSK